MQTVKSIQTCPPELLLGFTPTQNQNNGIMNSKSFDFWLLCVAENSQISSDDSSIQSTFNFHSCSNSNRQREKVGGSDKCAILDFSQRHLTGHSWTYLRNFWFCRIFFRPKLPPCTAKTVFENPKGPPFWCWKYFFQNIFSNFLKKYFQKIFSIPKCYTILESWDRMP